MLACRNRRQCHLGVIGVRVRDQHRVHVVLCHEFLVLVISLLYSPLLADRLQHRVAHIAERRHRKVLGQLVQARQVHDLRDLATADNSDS
jgi:hypothetical protein